jgi:hypothetical protein
MPQKNFENKNKKNKNTLPSVAIDTRQRNLFAECQACSTQQKTARLPSANGQHLAKDDGGATSVA